MGMLVICGYSPKCRKEYPKSATPQKYYCFCKKQVSKFNVFSYEFYCKLWTSLIQLWIRGFYRIHVVMYVDISYCQSVATSACYFVTLVGGGWGFDLFKIFCLLGPCPPCPVTVMVTCYCGNSSPVSRRCGSKGWACQRICRRLLACSNHTCEMTCHAGTWRFMFNN